MSELRGELVTDNACGVPVIGTLLLAHGAGAPMDSDFMNQLVASLNGAGVTVVRFEFPYMQWSRKNARRRPPDRQPVLLQYWRDIYREVAGDNNTTGPLLIGGKSMGGRMASMVADELGVAGVCCFGYPFHPPGRPREMRTEHLRTLTTPCLILQGTRDALGTPEDLAKEALSSTVALHWLTNADHDFVPTKASGMTQSAIIAEAAASAAHFITGLTDAADREKD